MDHDYRHRRDGNDNKNGKQHHISFDTNRGRREATIEANLPPPPPPTRTRIMKLVDNNNEMPVMLSQPRQQPQQQQQHELQSNPQPHGHYRKMGNSPCQKQRTRGGENDHDEDANSHVSSEHLPHVQRSDLDVGSILGRGTFCIVRAVNNSYRLLHGQGGRGIGMKRQSNLQRHHHHHPIYISRSDSSCCSSTASMTSLDSDNTTTLLALPPDASLRNSTTTTTNNNDELAVKYLKSKCKLTKSQRARGRVDLGLEVEALTLLRDHSNIVTIRAVNTSSNNPSEVNFFLMDRLYGTIEQKIAREWRDRSLLSLSNAIIPGLPMRLSFEQCTDEEEPLLLERLQVASQVASALEYIHSERYVNRKEGKSRREWWAKRQEATAVPSQAHTHTHHTTPHPTTPHHTAPHHTTPHHTNQAWELIFKRK